MHVYHQLQTVRHRPFRPGSSPCQRWRCSGKTGHHSWWPKNTTCPAASRPVCHLLGQRRAPPTAERSLCRAACLLDRLLRRHPGLRHFLWRPRSPQMEQPDPSSSPPCAHAGITDLTCHSAASTVMKVVCIRPTEKRWSEFAECPEAWLQGASSCFQGEWNSSCLRQQRMYVAHVRIPAGSSDGSQDACVWQGLTGSPPGQI